MMPCFQRHLFLLYHVRGTRLKKGFVRIYKIILMPLNLPVSLTSKPVFFVLLLETNLMLRVLLLDVSFL